VKVKEKKQEVSKNASRTRTLFDSLTGIYSRNLPQNVAQG
jgi:hypothetical protein